MRYFTTIFFAIISTCFALTAQNEVQYKLNSINKSQSIDLELIKLNSKINFSTSLKNILDDLIDENITFESTNQNESLSGSHLTFQVRYHSYPIKDCIVKVHFNTEDQAYLLTHNLLDFSNWVLPENEPIYRTKTSTDLGCEICKIYSQKTIVILDENDAPKYAQEYILYNEQNGIYQELILTENTLSSKRDLRTFLGDTTISGKVFHPDPLTTAQQNYGGAYVDGFEKDSSVVILVFMDDGQDPITVGFPNFQFYGNTYNIPFESYPNTFDGGLLVYYFTELVLDGDYQIISYNTTLTDDTPFLGTRLIFQDYNHAALNSERVTKTMIGDFDNGVFNLENDYFYILDFEAPNVLPVTSTDSIFDFTRAESGFEDVNAFFHLNNFRNHIENLGFTNLDEDQIIIDTHGNNGGDNSYFTSNPTPRLSFGEGGVDDAEDADVIVHEYAHALSYFASPNSNIGAERKALDEGYGDYIASSYSRSINGFNAEKVFTWDGHNEFWNGRFSDLNRNYNYYDAGQDIYYNATIWSATLMDIWARIGRNACDQLVLESLFYNMPNGTMQDAANNLLLIDSLVFNQQYKSDIEEVLCQRAFIDGDCDIVSLFENQINYTNIKIYNSTNFSKGKSVQLDILDNDFEDAQLKAYDAQGKIIIEKTVYNSSITIDGQNWAKGTYYILIQTDEENYQIRLIR